jgi:hypothetical protein
VALYLFDILYLDGRDLGGEPLIDRKAVLEGLCRKFRIPVFCGVLEIHDNFDGDAYRAVYTTPFEGVLYVLHECQKRSASGIAPPQRHIGLVRQRLRDAEAIHKATKGVRR